MFGCHAYILRLFQAPPPAFVALAASVERIIGPVRDAASGQGIQSARSRAASKSRPSVPQTRRQSQEHHESADESDDGQADRRGRSLSRPPLGVDPQQLAEAGSEPDDDEGAKAAPPTTRRTTRSTKQPPAAADEEQAPAPSSKPKGKSKPTQQVKGDPEPGGAKKRPRADSASAKSAKRVQQQSKGENEADDDSPITPAANSSRVFPGEDGAFWDHMFSAAAPAKAAAAAGAEVVTSTPNAGPSRKGPTDDAQSAVTKPQMATRGRGQSRQGGDAAGRGAKRGTLFRFCCIDRPNAENMLYIGGTTKAASRSKSTESKRSAKK